MFIGVGFGEGDGKPEEVATRRRIMWKRKKIVEAECRVAVNNVDVEDTGGIEQYT